MVCGEKFLYKCPQCGADIDPEYQACFSCNAVIDWGDTEELVEPQPQPEVRKYEEPKPEEAEAKLAFKSRGSRLPGKKTIWLIAFIIVIIGIAVIFAVDIFL